MIGYPVTVQSPRASPPHRSPGLLGYSSVHIGKSLLWSGEDALTLYILVRLLHLEPASAGLAFLASALWNALCDGAFALALRRWRRLARMLPAVTLVAIPGSCLGFAALPLIGAGHAGWAIALLFLFRTSFSLIDLPHNALTRSLAGRHGHLGIARVRAAGAGAAALVIGAGCFVMLREDATSARAVPALIAAIGMSACLLMLPLPGLLRATVPDGCRTGQVTANDRAGGGPLWRLCLASAIGLAGLAATGKAMLHLDFGIAGMGGAALLIATAGRLGSVWLWSPVARRIGNRRALALAYLASGCQTLLIAWLPAGDTPRPILLFALFGVTGGGVALLSWAVLSETLGSDRTAARAGDYAAAFGLFTMSMKIGLGASAAFVGLWLAEIGGDHAGIAPVAFGPLACAVLLACGIAALLIRAPMPRRALYQPDPARDCRSAAT